MDKQVRLVSSAHVQVGRSKGGGQVVAVLDYEVRDCSNLLIVELAQPEVSVLVPAIAPIHTARLLSLIRVPATCPA